MKKSKEQILEIISGDVSQQVADIREYVMDRDNSFEDRFQIWINTPEHLQSCNNYVIYLPEFEKKYGEISWYDDFYCEKYETFSLIDIVANIDEQDWSEDKKRLFIESCLDAGYHSFKYDW